MEELQLARVLLDEEIQYSIAVDIQELGPGMLETAQKGEGEGVAGGVQNGEGRNRTDEVGGGSEGW